MQKRSFSVVLSKKEWIGGLCFLPFYLFLLSPLLQLLLLKVLRVPSTTLLLNICFYAVCSLATLLIFHRFLACSWSILRERRTLVLLAVPASLLLYGAVSLLTTALIYLIMPDYVNQNNGTVLSLMGENPIFVVLLSVVIAPIVEETLFRGLVFGSLRRCSRLLAYAVTALCFSAIHVLSYVGVLTPGAIALSMLQYVPATLVLCGVYEATDTIWSPIFLHAAVNLTTCLLWNYVG